MALRAVPEHPKFMRLKAILKLGKAQALGYLECVWHFCGRYTPQGDIGKYTDEEIEAWCEWDGEEGALIAALVKARWIDRHPDHRLVVHDWHKHADDATRLALKRAGQRFILEPETVVREPLPDTSRSSGNRPDGVSKNDLEVVDPNLLSLHCRDAVATMSGLPVPEPVPEPENLPNSVVFVGPDPPENPPKIRPPKPPPIGNHPESLADAQDYGAEIGLPNPEVARFCDFWQSRGWRGRSGLISDWRAAMRMWRSDWDGKAKGKPPRKPTFEERFAKLRDEMVAQA